MVDRLQLKVGINGAEPWTDEMRRKIEELLNVNSFDIYGLCEITGPGVALDCIHHKGMHVQEDYFYPEVLDPTDHTSFSASILSTVSKRPSLFSKNTDNC